MDQNLYDVRQNRGYAIVEYESHYWACQARRVLFSGVDEPTLWGSYKITVEWAAAVEPEDSVNLLKVSHFGVA